MTEVAVRPSIAMPVITRAMVIAEQKRRKQNLFYSLFPDRGPCRRELYDKHMEFFANGLKHRVRLFRAANRCITPWTFLDSNNLPALSSLGVESFDVHSWGDGKKCTAQAEQSYLKGILPAFRVVLDNGQFFDCTDEHLVLTDGGYLSLRQLVLLSNGLRLKRKHEDYQASCVEDGYLCDQQLQFEEGIFSASFQEQDDVLKRSRFLWRMDEVAHRPQYNHALPSDDRLSNHDGLARHAALFSQFLAAFCEKPVLCLSDCTLEFRRSVLEYCQDQPVFLSHSNQDAASLAQIYTRAALENFVQSHALNSGSQQSLSVSCQDLLIEELHQDVTHKQIFLPFSHPSLIGGQKIFAIVPIGLQPIIDFHVPVYNNYSAAGVVHHNSGKTIAGAYECVCHLTGIYPSWWKGRRFKRPVNILVAGESGKLTRDSLQMKIMGDPANIGTGIMPKDCIMEIRAKAGIPDAMDTVRIKHLHGVSTIQYLSFDQGREAFQATERDVIWLDEEPPMSVYTEALTRTMTTGGIVMITFTPLRGLSETVMFLENQFKEGGCQITSANWGNAPHLSEEDCAEMLKAYPPHQRDARSKGIPSMGSGAIYPVQESEITCEPFAIPKHWRHVYGLDVGWNFTAAVFGAYDPDADILYITSDYKRSHAEPSVHAGAIKARARGEKKPGVIDPASKGRSQTDGVQLISLYKGLGLNLQEADNAVETGLYAVWERLSLGKMKVFRTCQGWFDEFRIYRRDEKGKIVKQDDHEMDATRYLVMSGIQLAKPENPVKKKIVNTVVGSWMGR